MSGIYHKLFRKISGIYRKVVVVGDDACGKTNREDYSRLRPLSYPDSDIILFCFSIDSPNSLNNVEEKWISEVFHFHYGFTYILVGCKKDLRNDPNIIAELKKVNQQPVSYKQLSLYK
ncbi:ras-domain-containing protein [Anaeromyces robustus]|uniref:Ras-domain-containing protein n=1 Tax=Anaeromyces robustus TaxID=1754192 RepID=A0A1Y1XE07_9FUNG|nr:ras-domain-containing protein [Anaeromyces robustus]|eukprot:ORX83686.1 ras-domain-containing protein [Anaeromyces robustus]